MFGLAAQASRGRIQDADKGPVDDLSDQRCDSFGRPDLAAEFTVDEGFTGWWICRLSGIELIEEAPTLSPAGPVQSC